MAQQEDTPQSDPPEPVKKPTRGGPAPVGKDDFGYNVNANGQRICGAKLRRSGDRYCQLDPVRGGKRCHLHGGLSPSGLNHYRIGPAKWSKHIPPHLLATYNAARKDPHLTSLRQAISLLYARIAELLDRVQSGEHGTLWEVLGEQVADMEAAEAREDWKRAAKCQRAVCEIIKRGHESEQTWLEIRDTLQEYRKLTTAEWKRQVDLRQTVTAEQLLVFVAGIGHAIRRHVKNPEALKLLERDIRELVAGDANTDPAPEVLAVVAEIDSVKNVAPGRPGAGT